MSVPVSYFQLAAQKGAVRLESRGMKHSSGRSVTAMMRKHYGLKRNTSHQDVIKRIEEEMKKMRNET